MILYLKNKANSKILEGFQKAEANMRVKNCGKYEITNFMFRLIYGEVKMNIPFYHHNELVKLFKMANVNMGYHHYERTMAQRITCHIASEMRKQMIQGLKNSQTPVSIITDGATGRFFCALFLAVH